VAPGQKLEEILEVHRSAVAVPGPKLDNEDAFLDVPEIVAKYGYPIEIHEVTTADGYILTVHHIPYGKNLVQHLINQSFGFSTVFCALLLIGS